MYLLSFAGSTDGDEERKCVHTVCPENSPCDVITSLIVYKMSCANMVAFCCTHGVDIFLGTLSCFDFGDQAHTAAAQSIYTVWGTRSRADQAHPQVPLVRYGNATSPGGQQQLILLTHAKTQHQFPHFPLFPKNGVFLEG